MTGRGDGDDLPLAEIVLGLLVTASRYGSSAVRVAAFPARVVAGDRVDEAERKLARTGRRAAGRGRDALADAAGDALDDPELRRLVDDGIERLLASPELDRLIERIASSPALRAAVVGQTTTYVGELRELLRDHTAALDDRVARAVRRRPPPPRAYGGLAARAIALSLDLALVAVIVLAVGVAVGLVSSLAGRTGPLWLVGALLGGAWVVLADAYLVFFWTALGQTPGMRLFALRVAAADGRRPRLARSAWRAVGLALAILPLFAGLLPVVFDGRRRGLHDLLAGTTVAYDR